MRKKSFNSEPKNPSLLKAYGGLLARFDRKVDPRTLRHNLDDLEPGEDPWVLLSLIDPRMQVVELGTYGTWPSKNNAVIRFRVADDLHPGQDKDYYCLVAEAGDRQVFDPATGSVINGNVYGQPIDWAEFELVAAEVPKPVMPALDGRTYVVPEGGESAWDIALRKKISATDLIELNEILEASLVPGGTVLKLPEPKLNVKPMPAIVYEVFERPKKMHVAREGGTRKQAFGGAKFLESINATGPTYRQDTNLTMVAVAHVPLIAEGREVVAAYYMDAWALGDYEYSGRVAWEVGYNHSHLMAGHVLHPGKAPLAKRALPADVPTLPEPAAVPERPVVKALDAVAVEAEPVIKLEKFSDKWKSETPLPGGPAVFVADQDMVVKDLDHRRPDKLLPRLKGVVITGTFEKEDDQGNVILYGRPQRTEKFYHWYGIPMDLLTPEEELFNVPRDFPHRVTNNGPFSLFERYVSVPLYKHRSHPLVKKHVDKFKKQK